MRMILSVKLPIGTLTPHCAKTLYDPAYGLCIFVFRPKVPALRVSLWLMPEFFGKREVTRERFQHMLPWTG